MLLYRLFRITVTRITLTGKSVFQTGHISGFTCIPIQLKSNVFHHKTQKNSLFAQQNIADKVE